MSKRADLIKAYISALGTSPLIVLSMRGDRPSRIASQEEKQLDLIGALWFAKPQHAELVLTRTLSALDAIGIVRTKGWFDLPGRELLDAVVNAAAEVGAPFRSMDEIQREAGAVVDGISTRVENARRAGKLAEVNAAYKVYREAQTSRGEQAISYTAHLTKFTKSLIEMAAKNANAIGLTQPRFKS